MSENKTEVESQKSLSNNNLREQYLLEKPNSSDNNTTQNLGVKQESVEIGRAHV